MVRISCILSWMDARKAMDSSDAQAYLAAARRMTFAGVDGEGRPFARVFDVAVHEGQILFHGALRGEKLSLLGREVVAERHEVVAEIPSYFTDAERACPATTFYRSVQVRGRVEAVERVPVKARLLQRLMDQRQDVGSFRPLDPGAEDFDRLYGKTLAKLLVARVVPDEVVGRFNVGQHKSKAVIEQILEGLWRRGGPQDLQALGAVLAAHPRDPCAPFMQGPEGLRLVACMRPALAQAAAELLHGAYWREGISRARLASIQGAAPAWVGYQGPKGELVATARAVSDGCDYAYVGDVMVHPAWRGRGVGKALMAALLDHPKVRHARHVFLVTLDAQSMYDAMGFEDVGTLRDRALMRLRQGPAA